MNLVHGWPKLGSFVGMRQFASSRPQCIDRMKLSKSVSRLLQENGIDWTDSECERDLEEPLLSHLHRRGLLETVVNEDVLAKEIASRSIGLYCGADPTARSLHIGNLLPLMILLHFNIRGHNIFPLVGGATGAVGDPSGRKTERDSMATEKRLDHVARISKQFINFFDHGLDYAVTRNPAIDKTKTGTRQLKNNFEWWEGMGMLTFLAKYGRYIRVNQMLARDSIKSRLTSDQGIGFNEFTYQVLQAYDFWHLHNTYNVDVQVGGNDQYGNIVAGIDLIARLKNAQSEKEKERNGSQCYGLTVPLLTTSAGVKFGKSAGNAIFIDRELTPSYQVYQHMYRSEDADVQKFLYKFSLLPLSVIDKVVQVHNADKKKRLGQTVLAMELCDLIHGDGEGYSNYIVSQTLYGKGEIDADQVISAFRHQGMLGELKYSDLDIMSVPQLLFELSHGNKSKTEFRRMIKGGSVSVGRAKEKITDPQTTIDRTKLIDDRLLMLRAGKDIYLAEFTQ